MLEQDQVNILLVDDQPAKLLSYEVVLGGLGENLIKAGSAREALVQLLRHEIAVILTDVSMPELDGFELAAMIREHPPFPGDGDHLRLRDPHDRDRSPPRIPGGGGRLCAGARRA
jgi:CheY-like chemotaxis protein